MENQVNVKTLSKELNQIFKISQAEDFDNVGLLCGNPNLEVTGILICHDALEDIIEEAITKKINFVVAFHPIIFSGLKNITSRNYVEKTILKAIENRIAIYAIHTAFDNDFFGVNYGICKALGLQNRKILLPKNTNLRQLSVYVPHNYSENLKDALFSANAGNIGFYDECSFKISGTGSFRPLEGSNPYSGERNTRENADEEMVSVIFESDKQNQIIAAMKSVHPYEEIAFQIVQLQNDHPYIGLGMYGDLENEMDEIEFLEFVKQEFNLSVIRHSGLTNKKIKKVGVLGGSGANGIGAAISAKCDAYLCGDLKYHDFFMAENKILLGDIGHYESEQFIVQQLFEILSEKFPKFAISKTSISTNPVNYFL